MPAPSYLAKDRHGAFLFRIKIPIHLYVLFSGKKVITKSLKTYHRPTALKLARRYASKADDLFYQLDMKSKYIFDKTILKAKRSLANATLNDLTDNLSPEALALLQKEGADTSPELDDFIVNADMLGEKVQGIEAKIKELDLKVRIAEDVELRNSVLKDYGIANTQLEKTSPMLSILWDAYRSARIRQKLWRSTDESKIRERDAQFRDFIEIIGGEEIINETRAKLRRAISGDDAIQELAASIVLDTKYHFELLREKLAEAANKLEINNAEDARQAFRCLTQAPGNPKAQPPIPVIRLEHIGGKA